MFRTSLFAALAVLTLPAPTLAQTVAERWQAAQNTCHNDEAIIRARFSACSTAIDLGAAPASGATADDMTSALLTRTQIHIHMEDYSHAIADADRAATYVEKFTRVHHARCWARALADVELDTALAACNRSFEISWSDTEPIMRAASSICGSKTGKPPTRTSTKSPNDASMPTPSTAPASPNSLRETRKTARPSSAAHSSATAQPAKSSTASATRPTT